MSENNPVLASGLKCHCGAQAVVFVGGADPDMPQHPMCRPCADQWHQDVLLAMFVPDVYEKEMKRRERANKKGTRSRAENTPGGGR